MTDRPPTGPVTLPLGVLVAESDAEFAAAAGQIGDYLLDRFPGLRGLGQRPPHFDPERGRTTDPVEHTVEVTRLLDTRGLDPRSRLVVRLATIFHDVGKLHDPLDPRHAIASAALCAPLLPEFALTVEERADVLAIVAMHDVLGQVAVGRLTPTEAAAQLRTPRLAELARRLTTADVASIRGLTGAPARIEAAYHAVLPLLNAR